MVVRRFAGGLHVCPSPHLERCSSATRARGETTERRTPARLPCDVRGARDPAAAPRAQLRTPRASRVLPSPPLSRARVVCAVRSQTELALAALSSRGLSGLLGLQRHLQGATMRAPP
mmetsp:Transcript_272/g.700  ORF Transcript_272/g.700 Transcript_272/m.700 type:complete len:117 (+) Transcript_272:415-765(+)